MAFSGHQFSLCRWFIHWTIFPPTPWNHLEFHSGYPCAAHMNAHWSFGSNVHWMATGICGRHSRGWWWRMRWMGTRWGWWICRIASIEISTRFIIGITSCWLSKWLSINVRQPPSKSVSLYIDQYEDLSWNRSGWQTYWRQRYELWAIDMFSFAVKCFLHLVATQFAAWWLFQTNLRPSNSKSETSNSFGGTAGECFLM